MNKIVQTIFASSLLLFSLGISSTTQAQIKQPKSLADKKTEAEIKKAKADRFKTIIDIATNKTLLTAVGVVLLLVCGRSQIGEYLGRMYGNVKAGSEAHTEAVKSILSRCYKAVSSLPLNVTHNEAMSWCRNPNLKLADIAKFEVDAQAANLMIPVNAYWGLTLEDKAKLFVNKIFGSAIAGISNGVSSSWSRLFNLSPEKA